MCVIISEMMMINRGQTLENLCGFFGEIFLSISQYLQRNQELLLLLIIVPISTCIILSMCQPDSARMDYEREGVILKRKCDQND